MSRPDKRSFQANVLGTAKEEGGARLFAFTNARQGYQVVFSPEEPVIVLKTKRSAVPDQHPCLQWEPLSTAIFARRPATTHAMFVLDAAPSADAPASMQSAEQEELSVGASIGAPLKRVVNVLTRLNPHNGTLVAAGVSAIVAFKYMLVGEKTLGHRDRLMKHLILVCPGGVDAFRRLGQAIQRRNEAQKDRTDYPLPDITVLVKPEDKATQGEEWNAWLKAVSCAVHPATSATAAVPTTTSTTSTLFEQARVVANLSPTLFEAVASAAGIEADGSVLDMNKQLETPEVYRIALALSRVTKTIEQYPLLAPLHTPGYEDLEDPHDHAHACGESCESGSHPGHDHDAHDGSEAESVDDDDDAGDAVLVAGLSSLAFCRDPARIVLEGRVLSLEPGLIGTTEGVVSVSGIDALLADDATLKRHVQSKLKLGAPVFASASLVRDDHGCTSLHLLEMRPMTKVDVKHSVTVGATLADIPLSYNVSKVAHAYGAVLVRGRKCALVRPRKAKKSSKQRVAAPSSAHEEIMHIPFAPHSETGHNAIECATEALCQGCEVSADNFYFPSYISPITYYIPAAPSAASAANDDARVQCVTLYVALAVSPSPRGAVGDAVEDAPEPEEPYDWVSFARALQLLGSEAEKEALRSVQKSLATAAAVGLYKTFKGCGLFGEAVKPLAGETGALSAGAAPISTSSAAAPTTSPVSLEALPLFVLFCPGVSTAEARELTRRVLPKSPCVEFSLYTTPAMLQGALRQHALQTGKSEPFLLVVADDVDAASFCEERLLPLWENDGVDVSVLTVLTTQTAERLFAVGPTSSSGDEAALLDRLAACVGASDAVVAAEAHTEAFSPALWGAIALAAEANPEAALIAGLDARRPLECVADRVFGASPNAESPIVLHRLIRTTTTPLAPAALHFLTQTDSLARFYAAEEAPLRATLVLVSGEVWVATRTSLQGRITLDAENRCLEITPGAPWEEAASGAEEPHQARGSRLCFVVQLLGPTHAHGDAVTALCAKLASLVDEVVHQVEYQPSRDGPDYHNVYDPLPSWEDGWDDASDHAHACTDGCHHTHH